MAPKFREGLFRISLAKCAMKKGLAVPIYMDSQASRYPPPKSTP
jgi:hypothetical protein